MTFIKVTGFIKRDMRDYVPKLLSSYSRYVGKLAVYVRVCNERLK